MTSAAWWLLALSGYASMSRSPLEIVNFKFVCVRLADIERHAQFFITSLNIIVLEMVRYKNRYLLCEIAFEHGEIIEGLSPYAILGAVNDELNHVFGDASALLGSIQVKYYSCFTNLCIIRASRDFHKHVWAAITLMTSIRNRKCAIRMVHVGDYTFDRRRNNQACSETSNFTR